MLTDQALVDSSFNNGLRGVERLRTIAIPGQVVPPSGPVQEPALPAVRTRLRGGLPPRASRRVCDYIEAHLNERLENSTLAAIARLSVCHFVRSFRQSYGVPPRQFIVARRVDRVKALLVETELSLSEIAITAGFADQSHCCRCFRARVGATPGDYRWSMR
jgi:AraC family transcriptional regulator